MSVYSSDDKKITVRDFRLKKEKGEPIAMLTAYDYPVARALDRAGIDAILVGDSLGMVALGYANTLPVTMDEMIHHCKAVARGASRPLLIGDMPFLSYQTSPGRRGPQRRTLPQGSLDGSGQARGRARDAARDPGRARGGHPGARAPRPHAAVGPQVRRDAPAGPHRRGRAPPARRRAAPGTDRRVRDRAGIHSRRGWPRWSANALPSRRSASARDPAATGRCW